MSPDQAAPWAGRLPDQGRSPPSQGCGTGVSGVYSLDVHDPHHPVVRQALLSNTDTAGIWGRGGPIIGRPRFHKLITAYLAEFPSESYTLRDLGARFPRFLQEHPEWTAPHTFLAHEAAILASESDFLLPLSRTWKTSPAP